MRPPPAELTYWQHEALMRDGLERMAEQLADDFPACAARLWGNWNGTSYRMPSDYGGADCRGDIVLCHKYPKMGTPTVDVANWRTWEAKLTELDPEGDHWADHYFGSWATDFEALHVSWTAPYLATIEEMLAALENYPVLDEMALSEIEHEAAAEAWENMSVRDRLDVCRDARVSAFAARRDELPRDVYTEHVIPDFRI